VSDHGRGGVMADAPENITLPDGSRLEQYTALLMVKDFNQNGKLINDETFMTNADVPLLATAGLIDSPVNPATGKALTSDKSNGVTITTSSGWEPRNHYNSIFKIDKTEWLHIHDDIYKQENWEGVSK
jgi:hypothetical protein